MNDTYDKLWEFFRGDMSYHQFSNLLNNTSLEKDLGKDLYLELICLNSQSEADKQLALKKVEKFLKHFPLNCQCVTYTNFDVLDIGDRNTDCINHSIKLIESNGKELPWLFLGKCEVCKQNWLVAKEDTIYKVYCLHRLSNMEAVKITNNHQWPKTFCTIYELIQLAYKKRKNVCYENFDPKPFIEKLFQENREITANDIAKFLDFDLLEAEAQLKAIKTKSETANNFLVDCFQNSKRSLKKFFNVK